MLEKKNTCKQSLQEAIAVLLYQSPPKEIAVLWNPKFTGRNSGVVKVKVDGKK